MISMGGHRQSDECPCAGARTSATSREVAGSWPRVFAVRVGSWLACRSYRAGRLRGHHRVDDGRIEHVVALAARHRKLADLDVKAATRALRAVVLAGTRVGKAHDRHHRGQSVQ